MKFISSMSLSIYLCGGKLLIHVELTRLYNKYCHEYSFYLGGEDTGVGDPVATNNNTKKYIDKLN